MTAGAAPGRVGGGAPFDLRSRGLFGVMVVAWAMNYLIVRAGLAYSPPIWLAAGRAGIGALVAAVLLFTVGPRPRLSAADRRDAILVGLPNTALFFGLWFVAARQVLPGEASVIVYTFPLWVAALSGPVLGQRPSLAAWGALGLGFSGIAVIAEPWTFTATAVPLPAILELLVGSLGWAVGTVLVQRRFVAHDMAEVNFFQLAGGAAALLVASAVFEPALPAPSLGLLAALVWLGVVGTALAYGIWFWLLGRQPAARLCAYLFLVPVTALGASALILDERLDLAQLLGVAAVLVSIYVIGRSSGHWAVRPTT